MLFPFLVLDDPAHPLVGLPPPWLAEIKERWEFAWNL